MRYSRFEKLVLILGVVAVVGSLALSFVGSVPRPADAVSQVLLLVVIAAAVRFGSRGGSVAAIAASCVHLLMRVDVLSGVGVDASALSIVLLHMLAFGLVGVAGGEVCGRMKYAMTTLEGASALDSWSRVYNQRWAHNALSAATARQRRYGEPFSVIIVNLSPSLVAGFRPSRQRTIVRAVADHMRADVRTVDEIARLDDGRFVVLLPHTPKDGGQTVRARLAKGARDTLGAREESLVLTLLGAPEDQPAIDALLGSIESSQADQSAASSRFAGT